MNATIQPETRARTGAAENNTYVSPGVNIFESTNGYVLEAEMPGVNKQGLEITLDGNELTITGHREHQEIKGEALYREIRTVDYRRVFELDPTIDAKKIQAKIEQGLLTLSLPRAEKVKPQKIAVAD
jgi:HSP20 family protein